MDLIEKRDFKMIAAGTVIKEMAGWERAKNVSNVEVRKISEKIACFQTEKGWCWSGPTLAHQK